MSRFHETNVKFANHGPRMNEHANLERAIPTAISAKSGKMVHPTGVQQGADFKSLDRQTGAKPLTGFCGFARVLANRTSLPIQAESGAV